MEKSPVTVAPADCSPWAVCNLPHLRGKRKLFSPSKSSPDAKRRQNLSASEYMRWTKEEKTYLVDLVTSNGETDWKTCSRSLFERFGKLRSEKNCYLQYRRCAKDSEKRTCEVAVQTDLSVAFGEVLTVSKELTEDECYPVLRQLLAEDITSQTVGHKDEDPKAVSDSDACKQTQKVKTFPAAGDHTYCQSSEKKTKLISRAFEKRVEKQSDQINSLKEFLSIDREVSAMKDSEIEEMAEKLLANDVVHTKVVSILCHNMADKPLKMRKRKKGQLSVLMPKDFESLKMFNVADIVSEFQQIFPDLLIILLNIMLPRKNLEEELGNVLPRLALIYSVMMQSRVKELSRLQRTVAIILADTICDQVPCDCHLSWNATVSTNLVFDRLNRLGVCSPYCVTSKMIGEIGERYPALISSALESGKYVRFIGDNLNIAIGTSHETQSIHKHMKHMFISTCLVSDHYFLSKPEVPEIDFANLNLNHLMLSDAEYAVLRGDMITMVMHTMKQHMPQLSSIASHFPDTVVPRQDNITKTEVIPLPCLPYNEQKLQDDVKILEWYQQLFNQVIEESGVDPNTRFQIGGDQLTRERLSEAMLLRLQNLDRNDRFGSVGRCTFEFFHLGMNFLERAIFQQLWNKEGDVELGHSEVNVRE